MTSLRDHKTLVREYFRMLDANDLDAMFSLVADEVKIWHPIEGHIGKHEFRRIHEALLPNLDGNLCSKIISLTAEDARVAAQVEGGGMLKNVGRYSNRYCWLFVIRDGLIVEIFDYADTWPWRRLGGPKLLGDATTAES